jgi:hypothetical protein
MRPTDWWLLVNQPMFDAGHDVSDGFCYDQLVHTHRSTNSLILFSSLVGLRKSSPLFSFFSLSCDQAPMTAHYTQDEGSRNEMVV